MGEGGQALRESTLTLLPPSSASRPQVTCFGGVGTRWSHSCRLEYSLVFKGGHTGYAQNALWALIEDLADAALSTPGLCAAGVVLVLILYPISMRLRIIESVDDDSELELNALREVRRCRPCGERRVWVGGSGGGVAPWRLGIVGTAWELVNRLGLFEDCSGPGASLGKWRKWYPSCSCADVHLGAC